MFTMSVLMLTCIIRDKIKEIKIAAIKKHCNGFRQAGSLRNEKIMMSGSIIKIQN